MHDEYSQDEAGAELSTFGRLMADRRHGRCEVVTTAAQRQTIMRGLAALSPRTGGGRPRTVQHREQGYCRCAACRQARGER